MAGVKLSELSIDQFKELLNNTSYSGREDLVQFVANNIIKTDFGTPCSIIYDFISVGTGGKYSRSIIGRILKTFGIERKNVRIGGKVFSLYFCTIK